MEIKPKSGVGELLFGMRESDVKALYGAPDRQYKDEDKNLVYLYNDKKLRLTFYQDEDFRLGYIIASGPGLELSGGKVTGQKWDAVKAAAKTAGIGIFEQEAFDSVDNYFNEDNWIIFQVEFDEVIRIELGAVIINDEFDWKFK